MIEPDYYPLAMAAKKIGYSEELLISLAAEGKLPLYARMESKEALIYESDMSRTFEFPSERCYLSGIYKVPASALVDYQNDHSTYLNSLDPAKNCDNYYALHTPIPFNDFVLFVSAEDVTRLSKKETVKTAMNETERNTMLKLIIGMAIDAYGYDKDKPRNDASGDNKNSISTKLALKGITITDDTVRKYLKEAKNFL